MKRNEMIKDKHTFNSVIRTGKFVKDENYVIYYLPNNNLKTMFGIAIKSSIGKAVVRNKLKRQTRFIIDKYKNQFKNNYNYIIMIREKCLINGFNSMDKSLSTLIERIKYEKK